MLLPKFYSPIKNNSIQNKIGLIPHKSNYNMYLDKYDKSLYYLINPMDDWKNVINSIYSCKCIVSSSLHGLICYLKNINNRNLLILYIHVATF